MLTHEIVYVNKSIKFFLECFCWAGGCSVCIYDGKSFQNLFCTSLIIQGQSICYQRLSFQCKGYQKSDTNLMHMSLPELIRSKQGGMSAKKDEAKL